VDYAFGGAVFEMVTFTEERCQRRRRDWREITRCVAGIERDPQMDGGGGEGRGRGRGVCNK
jgi:hypothetical protein